MKTLKYGKIYYELVRPLIKELPDCSPFSWVKKYPVIHKRRRHLFDIAEYIISNFCVDKSILDQGGAEGIITKVLTSTGYRALLIDKEKRFIEIWRKLEIDFLIGDCLDLEWWDGRTFDIVIATVWPTASGGKALTDFKKDIDKCARIKLIKSNWMKILSESGEVFFDVNTKKYPLKYIIKLFSDKFNVKKFSTSNGRIILQCKKI